VEEIRRAVKMELINIFEKNPAFLDFMKKLIERANECAD
jgi:hypothetical protein